MHRLLSLLLSAVLLVSAAATASADSGLDALTNQYRAANGLAALTTTDYMNAAAARRVQDIVGTAADGLVNFCHPDGVGLNGPGTCPAKPGGWNYLWNMLPGCTGIGENLVARSPAPSDPYGYAENAWINSAPHRANLLGNFTVVGSAVLTVNLGDAVWFYAVQEYAIGCGGSAPAPAPAPAPKPAPAPAAPAPAPAVANLPNTAMSAP